MNGTTLSEKLLLALTISLATLPNSLAQHDSAQYNYTMGPRYKVVWDAVPPEVYWDSEPAPDQLTVTAPGLGYVVDETGRPQLVLDWRDGQDDLMDRAYCGESFFRWALGQVREGQPFDPNGYRRRSRPAKQADDSAGANPPASTSEGEAAPTWTGERVVALSNPGHELRFVITPDGATATDNGAPVEVIGRDGSYRVYGEDYEAGVAVEANGYVWHYYRPR